MKVNLKIIISSLVIAVCGASLFLMRSVPVSRIWKSYQVLYADSAVDEQTVLSYLQEAGCREVISLSEQKQPLFSPFTPVDTMSDMSYLSKRNEYFSDKENRYRLFYIPETYEKQTEKAVAKLISDKNIRAGLDGKSTFPVLVPIVCCVLFLILLCVSKYKSVYFVAGVFPLLFTFSRPFYPLASAVILLLLSLFLGERFWKRKGAFSVVFLNVYTDVLSLAAVGIAFISSWKSGVLLILAICASIAALMILYEIQNAIDKKKAFTYVFMLSAKQFPVMYSRTARYTLVSICATIVLFVFFMLSARFVPQASVTGIAIPTPSHKKNMIAELKEEDQSSIPSLDDYYAWAWEITTFPYRNLNASRQSPAPAEKDERVDVPQFKQNDSGIEQYENTMYVFDNSFKKTARDKIDDLEYPAIEKLMKKQGDGITVTYAEKSSGETRTDSVSLVLLLISMGIPLLLYLYYSISGRRRYENGN